MTAAYPCDGQFLSRFIVQTNNGRGRVKGRVILMFAEEDAHFGVNNLKSASCKMIP